MEYASNGKKASGGKGGSQFGEIEVQWGLEKILVPLPPPASPLSSLKATLFNLTSVPPSHMKLIYKGAILKDDLATLAQFGLVDEEALLDPDSNSYSSHNTTSQGPSSSTSSSWDLWSLLSGSGSGKKARRTKIKKVIMLGSKAVSASVSDYRRPDLEHLAAAEEKDAGAAQKEEELETEGQMVVRIQEIVKGEGVKVVLAKMDDLENWLKSSTTATAAPTKETDGTEQETTPALPTPNARTPLLLSEQLLQTLLKLDSFRIPSDWADARKERKEGVRVVQGALDKVDELKEKLGKALKAIKAEEGGAAK